MTYAELERLIRRETNFRFSKHLANHDEWINPLTKEKVTVPRHKSQEIHPKTLSSILKKVGLK